MPELARRPELPSTPLPDGATSIEVDGRARPVHNSHGLLIHWSQEGQRNFWRWFGDSIAVDARGRPMVVHHGTQSEDDFTAFDGGRPVYVTESAEYAAGWANVGAEAEGLRIAPRSRLMPLYVRAMAARDMSEGKDTFNPGSDPQIAFYDLHDEATGEVLHSASDTVADLKRERFDAVVWWERPEFRNWAVLSAGQVKSALSNSGLFDPSSDHLADPVQLEIPQTTLFDEHRSPIMIQQPERDNFATDAEADRDFAVGKGSERPDQAWILSDRDQWYSNPSYRGPAVPHPDDDVVHDDELEGAQSTDPDRNDSIVLVEPDQLGGFEKRLAALNKKAVVFGLEPIKVVSTRDVLYERKFEYVGRDMDKQLSYLAPVPNGRQSDAPVILKRIEIEYPEIKLGNWRVVGKIEAAEGGNLTFGVTRDAADEAALSAIADHPITCEHCKTNRNRKDGFLLRDNDSGAYRQVGSNCLEDFTGLDPAAALFLARMHEVVRIVEGDLDDYAESGRANAVSTRRYLADVSYITENHGFVSSAKAKETYAEATFDEALGLPRKLNESLSLRMKYAEQVERHLAKADEVRAWFASKPEEGSFDRNVKLLLAADAIAMERKHLAFAAAAVPMYNRMLAFEAQARIPSVHVGAPGQKMNSVLSVDRVVPIESQYGTSHLVLMRDQDGNRLKWKTSACPDEIRNAGAGRGMEAAFKVKAHDEYKGVPQTSVTHLKVTRWLDLEKPAAKDDEPEHESPAVLYRTSLYWHPGDKPRDFSKSVIDSACLTAQQLVAEARERGIDQLQGEDEFVWYGSKPDRAGDSFSLYVLDIDGLEPTTSAYRQITELLGAKPQHPIEASADRYGQTL